MCVCVCACVCVCVCCSGSGNSAAAADTTAVQQFQCVSTDQSRVRAPTAVAAGEFVAALVADLHDDQ